MFAPKRLLHWFAVVILVPLVVGCGGKSVAKGKVTRGGEPVTSGQVIVNPLSGVPKSGVIQADGTYQVEGVSSGECIITVIQEPTGRTAAQEVADDKRKKLDRGVTEGATSFEFSKSDPVSNLPAIYADTQTSPLKYKLKRGRNQIDLDLQ